MTAFYSITCDGGCGQTAMLIEMGMVDGKMYCPACCIKRGIAVSRWSGKKCNHPKADEEHLADNSSCSGGCIYWCRRCGAISITSGRDARDWQSPLFK